MNGVLETVAAALLSLGGGTIIIGAFAQWFGRLWATRLIQNEKQKLDLEIESYRIKLRKSEFIFQKELEASSELVSMICGYLPSYNDPWMDSHDVSSYIASQLDLIESDIRSYIAKHGAIVRKDALEQLLNACSTAGAAKFEVTGPEPPESANQAAEKVLVDRVHDQSAI